MIGIAENNLRVEVFQIGGVEGFHCGLGADRHKTRGEYVPVVGVHDAGARASGFVDVLEFEK